MKTLSDIRFVTEQNVKDSLTNEDVLNWCNDAQMDFLNVNIPTTTTIALDTVTLSYSLPIDCKQINRLSLQSDINNKVDREFVGAYRIYNGKIIFPTPFSQADTLNIDYFKHPKVFAAVTDAIDLDDRYAPVYTSYCRAMYYSLPTVKQRVGEASALKEEQTWMGNYMSVKQQVVAFYSILNEPYVVDERW